MTKLTRVSLLTLTLLAITGWGTVYYKAKTPPTVTERIVYQDRILVKDRIVNKEVVRTETKPDGTKIVTETKVAAVVKTVEAVKTKDSVQIVSKSLSKYSLGVSVIFDYKKPLDREYQVEVGRRLFGSPAWITGSVNTKREVTLGVRYEF